MKIVAIDLGHSAVKLTYDTDEGKVARSIFPAAACPDFEFQMSKKTEQMEFETVEVNGSKFLVGVTALAQGMDKIEDTLKQNWVKTPGHTALLVMAKKVVDQHLNPDEPRVYVLGLPVKEMAMHKENLVEVAKEHLTKNEDQVFVLPQPLGIFNAFSLTENGDIADNESYGDSNWGVIDIGFYSTDFVVMTNGMPVDSTADGCDGTRMAAERLRSILSEKYGANRSLFTIERALRSGVLIHRGNKMPIAEEIKEVGKILADRIVDAFSKSVGQERIDEANGILVSGGGAKLVFEHIKEHLPHALLVEDSRDGVEEELKGSRYLVSEGYYRFGKGVAEVYS